MFFCQIELKCFKTPAKFSLAVWLILKRKHFFDRNEVYIVNFRKNGSTIELFNLAVCSFFDEKNIFDQKFFFFVNFRKNASKHQKSLV